MFIDEETAVPIIPAEVSVDVDGGRLLTLSTSMISSSGEEA